MITRIKLALVTTLIAGCPMVATANEVPDTTTGLRTEFFYAPLHELAQQGAPISARARQYLADYPTVAYGSGYNARAYAVRRGYHAHTYAAGRDYAAGRGYYAHTYALGSGYDALGSGYDARAYAPAQYPCAFDQSQIDSEGTPVGPYCFEH
jgi:hypothetical protein